MADSLGNNIDPGYSYTSSLNVDRSKGLHLPSYIRTDVVSSGSYIVTGSNVSVIVGAATVASMSLANGGYVVSGQLAAGTIYPFVINNVSCSSGIVYVIY